MFGLSDLKQTRVYQEAVEEGKEQGIQQKSLELVPVLLRLGLSLEEIANELNLSLEQVRQQIENQSQNLQE